MCQLNSFEPEREIQLEEADVRYARLFRLEEKKTENQLLLQWRRNRNADARGSR